MGEQHVPGIAVLTSGNGSTVEALVHATQDGRADFEVGLVVCSKPPGEAKVHERISRLNRRYNLDIEITTINQHTHPGGKGARGQTLKESEAICEKIQEGDFAHVALLGYMRILRGDLLDEYGWRPGEDGERALYESRMSNTHPGSLPETADTYGIRTSQRMIELGLLTAKHTFHLVSTEVDAGPIIAEHPLDIRPKESAASLFSRIQDVEKAALPYAIDKFLKKQEEFKRANS